MDHSANGEQSWVIEATRFLIKKNNNFLAVVPLFVVLGGRDDKSHPDVM